MLLFVLAKIFDSCLHVIVTIGYKAPLMTVHAIMVVFRGNHVWANKIAIFPGVPRYRQEVIFSFLLLDLSICHPRIVKMT